MAEYSEQKTSAELEREVAAQRHRVEARIGQIQDKLSPGQMVDELLSYAKNSGGGDFVANLGKSVSTNPLPVALLGVSLVWLIAKQGSPEPARAQASGVDRSARWSSGDGTYGGDLDAGFEYATISGGLRHLGHVTDESGARYSEFTDTAGKKFRALTDAAGNRAGHFVDDAGQKFRGFKDAAGQRVEDFRDQGGELMDAATGWAADTWRRAGDTVATTGDKLSEGRERLQRQVADASSTVQRNADQMSRTLLGVLHDQPLVGGALAFAVGAAVASALPHTEQEDQVFGEAADKLKQQAGAVASDAYEKGKDQVANLYEEATEKTSALYEQVKTGIAASEENPRRDY